MYENLIAAASQVIHASKVYIGDTGTSLEDMVEIPSGESAFTIKFEAKGSVVDWVNKVENASKLMRLRESMARVARLIRSQAYVFEQHVRTVHNIPQDADTLKRFHVKHIYQTLTTGYYKTVTLVFNDGSVYKAG